MEPATSLLEPLSAFQLLSGTVAAAVLIKAYENKSWAGGFLFLALAVLSIFTKTLAEYSPRVGAVLAELGGNPVSWWVISVAGIAVWMARGSRKQPTVDELAPQQQTYHADFREVAQNEISETLKPILTDVALLKSEIGFLEPMREALEKRFQETDTSIAKLASKIEATPENPYVAVAAKRMEREYLAHLHDRVSDLLVAHEADKDPQRPLPYRVDKTFQNFIHELLASGLPKTVVTDDFEKIKADIIGDAIYTQLDDREPFTSKEQKRQWHTKHRQIEHVQHWLDRRIKAIPTPPSDVAKLRILGK